MIQPITVADDASLQGARLARHLRLLTLLQSGIGYTAKTLATNLEVHRRTVYRDLDLLRAAGFPIETTEPDAGYRLPPSVCLPPAKLADDELTAVLLAVAGAAPLLSSETFAVLRQAIAKLVTRIPAESREQAARLVSFLGIEFPDNGDHPESETPATTNLCEVVLAAVREGRQLRLHFRPSPDGLGSTRFAPYRMQHLDGDWVIVGRSTAHCAVRQFRLADLRAIELLDDSLMPCQRYEGQRYERETNAPQPVETSTGHVSPLVHMQPMQQPQFAQGSLPVARVS